MSILFGALVVTQPGPGALTLVYLFGFYAILAGITEIVLGMPAATGPDGLRLLVDEVAVPLRETIG